MSQDFFEEPEKKETGEVSNLNVENAIQEHHSKIETQNSLDDFDDFESFPIPKTDFQHTSTSLEPQSAEASVEDQTKIEPLTEFQQDKDQSIHDEFDDFASFPTSKPFTEFQPTTVEPQAIQFEADFSQFSAFEEVEQKPEPEEDFDDDFDDFQEFTSAPALSVQADTFPQFVPLVSNISDRIVPVLDMMFPKASENDIDVNRNTISLKNPNYIKPIDSSLALNFQWNSSDIRKTLVESIGISSANIVFQDNWNPSMPRFAANLGIAPLEPLKPVKNDVSANNPVPRELEEHKSTFENKVKMIPDIPAVEFDWSKSNAGDPLDGEFQKYILRNKTFMILFICA